MATTNPVRSTNSGAATISSYDRPPSSSDNASKGYTISSLWQHKGQLYQPTAAPDATSAAWQMIHSPAAAPLDVLGASCICAGGLVAMKAGYTGPAINLTATVAASPVVTTVNILPTGELDNETVRKVLASADAATFVYVTRVYDQSTNANHVDYAAVSGKITRGFYITWDTLMSRYVLSSDQNYGTDGQALTFPAGVSVREDQLGTFFFGRGVGSQAGPNSQVFASFGTGAVALSIHTGESANGPTLAAWNAAARVPSSNANIVPVLSTPCVVSYNGTTNQITASVNENSYVWPAANTRVLSGGLLGGWDLASGKFSAMRFVGFAIANATPSATANKAIRSWFYTRFNVRPQVRDRVVLISDSRGTLVNTATCVTTGQASANIGVQLAEYLESDVEVINCSTSGWTNALHLTRSIPGLVATYRPGVKNIAVVLLGVNDFLVSAITPAQALAALNNNINTLRAAGWHVKVVSELKTVTSTNNAAAYTDQLSDLIRGGGTQADEVIDVRTGNTAVLSPLSGVAPFYYPDGLHPGAAVSGVAASRIAAAVDATLAGA